MVWWQTNFCTTVSCDICMNKFQNYRSPSKNLWRTSSWPLVWWQTNFCTTVSCISVWTNFRIIGVQVRVSQEPVPDPRVDDGQTPPLLSTALPHLPRCPGHLHWPHAQVWPLLRSQGHSQCAGAAGIKEDSAVPVVSHVESARRFVCEVAREGKSISYFSCDIFQKHAIHISLATSFKRMLYAFLLWHLSKACYTCFSCDIFQKHAIRGSLATSFESMLYMFLLRRLSKACYTRFSCNIFQKHAIRGSLATSFRRMLYVFLLQQLSKACCTRFSCNIFQ